MTTESSFKRTGRRYGDFDRDECLGERKAEGDRAEGPRSMVEQELTGDYAVVRSNPNNSNQLLLVALLDHVCSMYIKSPQEKDKLFKLLCSHLVEFNILYPLCALDEISSVKTQYKQDFAKLLRVAMQQLGLHTSRALPAPHSDPKKIFFDSSLPFWKEPKVDLAEYIGFHTSRYRDEFEELDAIGRGAYGLVFKARHKLDSTLYAVKKMAFYLNSPEVWDKTLREVKHLADLNHPCIIRYYTAWLEYQWQQLLSLPASSKKALPSISSFKTTDSIHEDSDGIIFTNSPDVPAAHYTRAISWDPHRPHSDDLPSLRNGSSGPGYSKPLTSSSEHDLVKHSFVVLHIQMELCAQTLYDWIQERNNQFSPGTDVYDLVDEEVCLHMLKQILQAVDYLNTQRLIHRDLKPTNIFLLHGSSSCIQLKLGDFGLVRREQGDGSASPLTPGPGIYDELGFDLRRVFMTSGVGTTTYASPEQLYGQNYGPESDMYSIGLILLELFQPFVTMMEKQKSLKDLRRGQIPATFTERWPTISSQVARLVDLDPAKRPTAHELLQGELFNSPSQTLENLQALVAAQKVKLQAQEVESLAKDREISQFREQLRHRDTETQRLGEQLQNRDTETQRLREQLRHRDTETQRLREQLQHRDTEIDRLCERLQQTENIS